MKGGTKLIIAVVVVCIAGALTSRAFPRAGFTIVVTTMVLCGIAALLTAVRARLRHRRREVVVSLFMAAAMLLLIFRTLSGGEVPYFLLLAWLAAAYLFNGRHKNDPG